MNLIAILLLQISDKNPRLSAGINYLWQKPYLITAG